MRYPEGLPGTYPFGHQHCTRQGSSLSQEHTVDKKERHKRAQVVAEPTVNVKKFSEPNSTPTCGLCDACGLPTTPRAWSGHDATNRRLLNEVHLFCHCCFFPVPLHDSVVSHLRLSASACLVAHVCRAVIWCPHKTIKGYPLVLSFGHTISFRCLSR